MAGRGARLRPCSAPAPPTTLLSRSVRQGAGLRSSSRSPSTHETRKKRVEEGGPPELLLILTSWLHALLGMHTFISAASSSSSSAPPTPSAFRGNRFSRCSVKTWWVTSPPADLLLRQRPCFNPLSPPVSVDGGGGSAWSWQVVKWLT